MGTVPHWPVACASVRSGNAIPSDGRTRFRSQPWDFVYTKIDDNYRGDGDAVLSVVSSNPELATVRPNLVGPRKRTDTIPGISNRDDILSQRKRRLDSVIEAVLWVN